MRLRSTAKGFTLIETLVALLIIVVVLGSSVVAGKAILGSAQRTTDTAQMNMLLDESVSNLRLLETAIQSNADTTDTLRGTLGLTSGAQVSGVFLAAPASTTTPQSLGALTAQWCAYDTTIAGVVIDPAKKCSSPSINPVSLIGIDRGLGSIACGVKGTTTNCMLSDLVNSASVGGELVAVRRTVHTEPGSGSEACGQVGDATSNRSILDASTPASGVSPSTCLYTSQNNDWNFYVRTIRINQYTCGNVADLPGCPAGLGNSYLRAIVSVRNFYNPSVVTTRTVILTDANLSAIKYN